MAFTFSKATDYPSTFESCKVMALELMASAGSLQPFSVESIQVQFTLRVLKYRLAKFACAKSWDETTKIFVKSFEFSFPELSIIVKDEDIRHKLCPCISEAEAKQNLEIAQQLKIQISVQLEGIPIEECSTDNASEFVFEENESIDSMGSSCAPEECEDMTNNMLVHEEEAVNIQFGDVDMRDYESDATTISSENTTCNVVSDIDRRCSIDIAELSAIKLTQNVCEPKFSNDPISSMQAARVVYHRDPIVAIPNSDDVTEVAVIHRKRGITYEIRDELRNTICSFRNLPPAEVLAKELKPLAYSNKQIWRIYYLMRGRVPIPLRDMKAPLPLAMASLLSVPITDIGNYLL